MQAERKLRARHLPAELQAYEREVARQCITVTQPQYYLDSREPPVGRYARHER